jgi:GntR family transcriptional repressor for pyruvate dehydrogenase complex
VTVRAVVRSLVALWSAQEQKWAEAATRRGSYPSPAEANCVVETHRLLVGAIAAGDAGEAERLARAHLATTQSVLIDDVDKCIVDAWSAWA